MQISSHEMQLWKADIFKANPNLERLCRPALGTVPRQTNATNIFTCHTFTNIFEAVKAMFKKIFKPPLERLCIPAWVLCRTAPLSPVSEFELDCE